MPIPLKCLDKPFKGQRWELTLGRKAVRLYNESDEIVAEFAPAAALEHFVMPSFSESIKYFGIRAGDKMMQFDVAKPDLGRLQDYLDRQLVAAGPEAISAVLKAAWRDTLIGAAMTIGGIIATVLSYTSAAEKPEGGKFYIMWGLVLFGLVAVGKGIYQFTQYSRLRSLAQETDEEN